MVKDGKCPEYVASKSDGSADQHFLKRGDWAKGDVFCLDSIKGMASKSAETVNVLRADGLEAVWHYSEDEDSS